MKARFAESGIQRIVRRFPRAFLALKGNAGLNAFSTFDFPTEGIRAWLLEEQNYKMYGVFSRSKVNDCQSLLEHIYSTVVFAIYKAPEECLRPDATEEEEPDEIPGCHSPGAPEDDPWLDTTERCPVPDATDDPKENTGAATNRKAYIPLTPLQMKILEALKERTMKKNGLADMLTAREGRRLYKPGGIMELMDKGLVANKPGIGYYSVEFPPPEWLSIREPNQD